MSFPGDQVKGTPLSVQPQEWEYPLVKRDLSPILESSSRQQGIC